MQAIRECLADMRQLLVRWSDEGIPADQVSHILTAISDAVTRRLIDLALARRGEAPVGFCWLAFGSQARGEQLLNADQDNALILADDADENDINWFRELAAEVSDGLDACGYVYCPGKVMASQPPWCKRLSDWHGTVQDWTDSPTEDAVMRVSIAFDLRAIHGDATLCDALQKQMLDNTTRSSIFQAALAGNVLATPAPLGIFRRFLVERDGEHKDTLNLKKRGILPIVEIVRLHALAHGIEAVNTLERLDQLAGKQLLNRGDSRNLQDALRFLMQLRLQLQAQQIRDGKPLSNYCNPHELPTLGREQLRDAFRLVHDAQRAVRQRYRQGLG